MVSPLAAEVSMLPDESVVWLRTQTPDHTLLIDPHLSADKQQQVLDSFAVVEKGDELTLLGFGGEGFVYGLGSVALKRHTGEDMHGFGAIDKLKAALWIANLLDAARIIEDGHRLDGIRPHALLIGSECTITAMPLIEGNHFMHTPDHALLVAHRKLERSLMAAIHATGAFAFFQDNNATNFMLHNQVNPDGTRRVTKIDSGALPHLSATMVV